MLQYVSDHSSSILIEFAIAAIECGKCLGILVISN